MKNLKLSVKLLGSYLIVALIGGIVGFIGVSKIKAIDEQDQAMYQINTKPLGEIGDAAVAFQRIRANLRDVIIDRLLLDQDVTVYVDTIKELDKKLDGNLKEFEKTIVLQEVRNEFENMKGSLAKFNVARDRILSLVGENRKDDAMKLMRGEALTLAKNVDASVQRLVQLKIDGARKKAGENAAAAGSAILFNIILTLVGAGIAAALGVLMNRSLSRPLNRVITGLKEGADHVSSASGEVSASSQSLAEGASEQAAGLQETSSSMEEMASMTKQNADSAHQARTMMAEVNQIVEDVNHHMGKMAEAISEITKSSEETGKIIKTIDEIAFQTNLLALNAAVEAARAGEAGAGFAVVADEVRNLAMRASEAAKNTNNLIENTIKAVKNGNELTAATQEAFRKNVEISEKIGNLVDEIAAASREQSQGISQVSKAVAEMDNVTQKNAANAEESASAAEEMNAQAAQMRDFVGDLVALVGGRRNGTAVSRQSLPSLGRGETAVPSVERSVQPVKGKKKDSPTEKPKKLRSNQIIPLGDNDFKDFKEF